MWQYKFSYTCHSLGEGDECQQNNKKDKSVEH